MRINETMSKELIIYEFSRKLLEPKRKGDKWVSTGFEKEIGFRTQELPPSIENAVHNEWFRIQDSYPPKEGEIALIAREIETYAVLAVANRLDEDGDRPLIGYRYFWLKNPSDNQIDGVGTLLHWWRDRGQPHFELMPHQEFKKIQQETWKQNGYKATPYQPKGTEHYDRRWLDRQQPRFEFKLSQSHYNYSYDPSEDILTNIKYSNFKSIQIKNKFLNLRIAQYKNINDLWNLISAEIKDIPYIFTIQEKSENYQITNVLDFHSFALYLKSNYNQPIAWAWNVNNLSNPNQLTLICCADEKSFKANSKNIKSTSPLDQPSIDPIPPDSKIQPAIQDLKRNLKQVAENERPDFKFILNELRKSNSSSWDWGQLIDEVWLNKQSKNEVEAKYRALVLLLKPDLKLTNFFENTPSDWIKSLRSQQLHQSNLLVNQHPKIAVDFQSKFIDLCNKELEIAKPLEARIDKTISQLLLLTTADQLNEEDFQTIEWLFCDSSENWKNYLLKYFNNLFNKLDRVYKQKQELDKNETDNFLEKVLEDLKLYNPNPSSSQSLSSYHKIAQILEKCQAYPHLAAFFYQLGTGQVPSSVKENCTQLPEIIPLSWQQEKIKIVEVAPDRQDSQVSTIVRSPLFIGAISGSILGLGTILGIGLESGIKLSDKFLYSPITKNKNEVIATNPYNDLYLYLSLLETGESRKDLQDKNVQNLQKELIDKIPNFNDAKLKTPEARKKLIKSPLYSYIKQLTPPLKEKLKEPYPVEQANAQPPLKSLEIERAKKILEQLKIYNGEINQTWNQETSEAIKQFQTSYKIEPATGSLDQETWSLLAMIVQDQQVKTAAQNYQGIVKKSKNYQDFKAKYEDLKQCKEDLTQSYLICLKNLK
jgi:hypothetical protein